MGWLDVAWQKQVIDFFFPVTPCLKLFLFLLYHSDLPILIFTSHYPFIGTFNVEFLQNRLVVPVIIYSLL